MSWLQHVPAGERAALIGLVAVVLGAPTVALGALDVPHEVADAVAVAAVTVALGAVAIEWRRHGAPAAERLRDRRTTAEADRERDRSIVVSAWSPPSVRPLDRLAARDPAFSLPVLLAAIRALAGGGPAAEVVDVRDERGRIVVDAVVRGAGATLVRVSRAADAPSPGPDAVPGPWKLDGTEPFSGSPAPIVADLGVGAARRALAVRDALDPRAVEALAWQISAALDAGDEACRPYVTADGEADLAYWRAIDLPPDEGPIEWLEVGQDGWFDRIEVALGARVLSLRRRAGKPDAPWELWRVRRKA